MTDASTRIWAWPHFDGWITGDWSANTYHDDRTVEYILASDHARIVAEKDAEIARLKLALGEILSYDRNFYDSGRPGYEAIARAALKESPDA